MRSSIIQRIIDSTPLDIRLKVSNEMAFIDLITKLGYRENKMWNEDDPEDIRIYKLMFKAAEEHTKHQMKIINEMKSK